MCKYIQRISTQIKLKDTYVYKLPIMLNLFLEQTDFMLEPEVYAFGSFYYIFSF